jgi:CheY-like chemotaxis protein
MKEEFDLIFMDLDMPVMNGPSAAAAIRRLERETNKHVPIIAMTSYDRDIDRQASINSGMDDYLVKGATQKELTEVINKFLGQIAEPEVESALPGQLGDSIYAVDLDSLKNLLGQTELEEVFRLFNSSISTFVESMYLSIEERNASAVNHFANCIKGPTAQMNLDKLTLVLSKIIAASENGDWLRVGQEYLKLRTGFSETLTQMKNMCEPHPHSQAGLVSEVS